MHYITRRHLFFTRMLPKCDHVVARCNMCKDADVDDVCLMSLVGRLSEKQHKEKLAGQFNKIWGWTMLVMHEFPLEI